MYQKLLINQRCVSVHPLSLAVNPIPKHQNGRRPSVGMFMMFIHFWDVPPTTVKMAVLDRNFPVEATPWQAGKPRYGQNSAKHPGAIVDE